MSSAVRTEAAWGELWQVFHRLLDTPDPKQRQLILSDLEASMRREAEELLAAHEGRSALLNTPEPASSDASASTDPLVGIFLGPYRVLRGLGAGGMGTVYLAEQSQPVHRLVALKVVRGGEAPEEIVRRFEAERQVLVMMNHPHVATAYEVGSTIVPTIDKHRPVPWLAMEWVAGLPIDVFCERFSLPREARLGLLRQMLSGLGHAHRKGIVHRDIKASNVMVTVRDQEAVAKVIDFGVAKSLGARVLPEVARTQIGTPIGTPGAMSPEQAAGDQTVNATSDVYSAGLLAARLLEGEVTALEPVIKRATDHDPTRRYRDAATFIEALDAAFMRATYKAQEEARSVDRTAGSGRGRLVLLAAALIAIVVAAAYSLLPRLGGDEPPAQESAKVETLPENAGAATAAVNDPAEHSQGVPIAITIDDLPASLGKSVAQLESLTADLLAKLAARKISATGFVNSGKVEHEQQRAERLDILRSWLDAGHDLGNHGAEHLSLNDVPVEQYLDDIAHCEPILHTLLDERGQELRYFRHPYLRTGLDLETKRSVEAWLEDRGYRVAPVTLENLDWMFSAAYNRRLRDLDRAGAEEVVWAYIDYTDRLFAFWEEVSLRLNGEPHSHVLLLHANQLNADHFDAVAEVIERRGYRYVTLDQALAHPIYESPDGYAGPAGVLWQFRWAQAAGLDIDWRLEPEPPEWIVAAFKGTS